MAIALRAAMLARDAVCLVHRKFASIWLRPTAFSYFALSSSFSGLRRITQLEFGFHGPQRRLKGRKS